MPGLDPATGPDSGRPEPDLRARQASLSAGLAAVRQRITTAVAATGRPPGSVTLVAVSKGFPAADVVTLARLGVVNFGENRDSEAAPKARTIASTGVTVRWHFVGRLQRNKCRSVARYADVVHSVDSLRLVGALGVAAQQADRRLGVLLQVSLDGDPRRGGAPPPEIGTLAASVVAEDRLRLLGLMAVAPLEMDPERAFGELAELSSALVRQCPSATEISAGMSSDLEAAIRQGATLVRVGSALFGDRTANVG